MLKVFKWYCVHTGKDQMNKEREEKHFEKTKNGIQRRKMGEVSCLFTASTNTARRTQVKTGNAMLRHTHTVQTLGVVADTPNMQDGLSPKLVTSG